jgi:hypothetical protein
VANGSGGISRASAWHAEGEARPHPDTDGILPPHSLDFDELIAEAEPIVSDGGAGLETGR